MEYLINITYKGGAGNEIFNQYLLIVQSNMMMMKRETPAKEV